jgi:hypothetical protein
MNDMVAEPREIVAVHKDAMKSNECGCFDCIS